jgi:hypothetical protein
LIRTWFQDLSKPRADIRGKDLGGHAEGIRRDRVEFGSVRQELDGLDPEGAGDLVELMEGHTLPPALDRGDRRT